MNRENNLQNEKKKYERFYNAVIIITFLILITLLVFIPTTFEMFGIDTKNEFQDNSIKQETLETSEANFIGQQSEKSVFESEYFVVIEKAADSNIELDEYIEYPNPDTTGYKLVYINEDGKVVRAENIKGIVWEAKE